jgi:predicted dehydrogenase
MGLGLIGAGAFARAVLMPALTDAGFERLVSVSSASGLSAVRLAERAGFERAAPSAHAVIDDPEVDVVVVATRHNTHAALTERALRAGKHVFCEKPLALTEAELDLVEDAWRSSGRHLCVGFNRRSSRAVREVRASISASRAPVVIDYRVSAGPIGTGHWYADRRQGGRLLGEVCHFVDTCAALAGERVATVSAFVGPASEAFTASDVVIAARLDGGSLATVTYASGGSASTAKERIEILGAGHTYLIDDFRSLVVDGRTSWSGKQDKGHGALIASFAGDVRAGGNRDVTEEALATSRAVIAALASSLSECSLHVTG